MAKNLVTEVYDNSKTSDEALEALKLTDLKKFKSPNGNNCPWKDGQELEYDRIVPITWENDRGTFYYLAIGFKNTISRYAIQMATKKGEGYKSGDMENDTEFKTFNLSGGLHDICDGVTEYTSEFLDKIHSWLKGGKLKIKVTTYYSQTPYGRQARHLVNIVYAE